MRIILTGWHRHALESIYNAWLCNRAVGPSHTSYLRLLGLTLIILPPHAVGGRVEQFSVGEDGVLSWSPPVPPNGVILYYNVIISTPSSGELGNSIEMSYDMNINLYQYLTFDSGIYNIKVTVTVLMCLCSYLYCGSLLSNCTTARFDA